MYDELAKQLREQGNWLGFTERLRDLFVKAADAIEELSHSVDLLGNANKSLMAAVPEWRRVEEKPPAKVGDPNYTGYLVYANGYYQVADYTTDKYDNFPYFYVNGEYEPGVTHFMPLPKPPKEGKP